MNKHLVLVGSALVLAGCQSAGNSYLYDGRKSASALGSVNVPVVTQTNYAFEVAAPGGNVPPAEAARLSAWFDSLGLQYGDVVYVEGDSMARSDVAAAPIVRIHVAQPGDTMWSIAEQYRGDVGQGRFVDALIAVNGGTSIQAGQAIRLP